MQCKQNLKKLRKAYSCFCRYICNHPQLLDGGHRVVFVNPKNKNTFCALNSIKLCVCIYEIRLQEDLMIDDIVIVDMANITFRDMCTLSPRMVLAAVKIYKVYKYTRFVTLVVCFCFAGYFFDEAKRGVFY